MTHATYADIFRPNVSRNALVYDFVLVIGASIFIALCAQIAIPVPFSPVPITGQTLAVLLTGILLGRKRAGAAILAYLAEGTAGLPVFAGGASGPQHLIGPTGGYLFGFILAAWVCGYLAERGWDRSFWLALLTMIAGKTIIYTCGLLWLSNWVGFHHVLVLGLYPFIPGMLIKIVLATVMLPLGWKFLGDKSCRS
jgi:biotin transport system substrate-specific component